MGEAKKIFCDGCKAEITPATYTQGSDSGEIHNHVAAWSEGPSAIGVKAELCDVCYDKIKTWLQGKIDAAAVDWTVTPPVVATVKVPAL